MQFVKFKPVQFEAIFYDGSLNSFEELKIWLSRNGGRLYVEKDEIRGSESILLYTRLNGTTPLITGWWVVKHAQDDFSVYTPEELNEKYEII